jgi:hypothetical protein
VAVAGGAAIVDAGAPTGSDDGGGTRTEGGSFGFDNGNGGANGTGSGGGSGINGAVDADGDETGGSESSFRTSSQVVDSSDASKYLSTAVLTGLSGSAAALAAANFFCSSAAVFDLVRQLGGRLNESLTG